MKGGCTACTYEKQSTASDAMEVYGGNPTGLGFLPATSRPACFLCGAETRLLLPDSLSPTSAMCPKRQATEEGARGNVFPKHHQPFVFLQQQRASKDEAGFIAVTIGAYVFGH